ncbi:hypothetical protein [Lactococcus fujiensis]|uniref:Uncharacterized protein n=1 Tax=Lactococcus fujiensis JCM 16395 TaxID=1291764 RepID=A0A2A5RJ05_9LACT|nr:hypothetical protein [Lactococcus fujiensis]PCR99101.1 hypothetical protein RT41_GL000484 [Lactococcus fujiensis JCM 16395]
MKKHFSNKAKLIAVVALTLITLGAGKDILGSTLIPTNDTKPGITVMRVGKTGGGA